MAAAAPEGPATLVVDFQDGLNASTILGDEAAAGVHLDWASAVSEDEALRSGTVENAAAAMAILKANPDVEAVEVAVPMRALGWSDPDDPLYPRQWNFPMIGAPVGWRVGGGAGVVVAVIDTGVSALPDLPAERLLEGRSFVPGTSSSADDHGHGTHVAGTIAQATNNGIGTAGVAPNATILPLKVLGADGSGRSDWIAAAIDEAVDQGAKVINLSLGGGHSDVIVNAVEKARKAGVVVVAAAGNSGEEGLGSPADARSAIGVSAVGPDDALAPYSTWGKGVEIAAPGGNKDQEGGGIVQATIDEQGGQQFAEWQGTSMASPHVAAAAAVLWGAGAQSADEVERYLFRGTQDRGDALKFGKGRLDVGASVRALLFARQGVLFLSGAGVTMALCWLAGLRGFGRMITVGFGGTVAGGLFLLPMLPMAPQGWATLLARPLMTWPGSFWAGCPLWQSFIWPVAIALLLGPSQRIGPLAMALCAGTGSWLLYGAAAGDTGLWWLPWDYDRIWLSGNGTLALLGALGVAGLQKLMRRGKT